MCNEAAVNLLWLRATLHQQAGDDARSAGASRPGLVGVTVQIQAFRWHAQHGVERSGSPNDQDQIEFALSDPSVIRAEELVTGGL